MSQMTETPVKTYVAKVANMRKHYRVKKLAGGIVDIADALDVEHGQVESPAFQYEANGDIAVRLRNAQGSAIFIASGPISDGADVYGAAGGKVSATVNANKIGKAEMEATADGDFIEVVRY